MLKMRLHSFDEQSIIDDRERHSSALYPVRFFYRAMNVYGVEREYNLIYPCWDIEAHAFYDEAEKIISISRNHLLPDAEIDAQKRVMESADEALDLLFL